MASFLDKIKVKTALDDRVKLDLGCDHLTTQDWMEFLPVYNKEIVPKEKIEVNMLTTCRMNPLVRPTFGRANINLRAFFVPYDTVMPGWHDFITDTPHQSYTSNSSTVPYGLINKAPFFKMSTWTMLMTTSALGYVGTVTQLSEADFVVYDNMNTPYGPLYYAYTALGRRVVKLMESLGYHIPVDINTTNTGYNDEEYSALPLLAAAKIYMDWYFPSAYAQTTTYVNVSKYFKYDVPDFELDSTALKTILDAILFVNYDSDYFTSSWDNPSAPNGGLYSGFGITTPESFRVRSTTPSSSSAYDVSPQVRNASIGGTSTDHARQGSTDGTPFIETAIGAQGNNNYATVTPISQFMLTALKSLTDYMKRHQLVGARALDRYLARFGVNLSAETLHRSVYLGSHKVPLNFGDVTSHTDTAGMSYVDSGQVKPINGGSALGDYAGKGIGAGTGNFVYENGGGRAEYGQFMIISSIVPAVGYWQGCDRNVKHVNKLDFWTPEFDNLGVQMQTKDEILVNKKTNIASASSSGSSLMTNQKFGYVPRYAEYKVSRDKITGDWTYGSMNTGEDAWWLFRDVTRLSGWNTASSVEHSLAFCRGLDSVQYNRIFQNGLLTSTAPDYFKLIYHFEIASFSPMKALYDSYEFDGGKEVTEDVNGVKMN